MLESFTEGDEIAKMDKQDHDKDYFEKSLAHKKPVSQMAAENLEHATLGESTSNMV